MLIQIVLKDLINTRLNSILNTKVFQGVLNLRQFVQRCTGFILLLIHGQNCWLIWLDYHVRKCLVWKINGGNINKLVAAMDTITLVK